MTEFTIADVSAGDRVTLEHDQFAQPFECNTKESFGSIAIETMLGEWRALDVFIEKGWRITAVEKPEPELPSEPGMYSAPYPADVGDKWHTDDLQFFYLNGSGNWVDIGYGQPTELAAPFTRLAPVPELAAQVIDRIEGKAAVTSNGMDAMFSILDWQLNTIREEFGVTS